MGQCLNRINPKIFLSAFCDKPRISYRQEHFLNVLCYVIRNPFLLNQHILAKNFHLFCQQSHSGTNRFISAVSAISVLLFMYFLNAPLVINTLGVSLFLNKGMI